MTTIARTRKLKRSVAALTGRIVVLPEHSNWDQARLAWNLAVDQQSAAVVFPESAEDVIAAVELARAFELRVTAQGTGHNAAPLGPLEDTVLVKTERMRGIKIDPEAGSRASTPASAQSSSSRPLHSTASPRSPVPRPMSASSATPSAAVSAGSAASTASPRATSTRSNS
jgi:FAD binding domain